MLLPSLVTISRFQRIITGAAVGALLFVTSGCGTQPSPTALKPAMTESDSDSSSEKATATASVESEETAQAAAPAPNSSNVVDSALPPAHPDAANLEPADSGPSFAAPAEPADAELPAFATGEWVSLFDGKSLEGWTSTKFGGEGDVMVEEGRLVMTQGNDMTGITTTRKDLPKSNYEILCEARRVQGSDFFCGLTFPVNSDPCSLILGGWGGGTCGLSSIDGFDASENSTSSFRDFELNRWYTVKLRVTDAAITAWIDDEELLSQELDGRRISIRAEVELSRPLGFSTWRTTGELRKVQLRSIQPAKKAP